MNTWVIDSMKLDPSLCILCRGRGWCGLAYCPVIARARATLRVRRSVSSKTIEGSTPPSIFIGRAGYPYVRIGPATPPLIGDTKIFDFPELWITQKIEDILEYRWSLITGIKIANVKKPEDKLIDELRLLAMSSKPVDVEIILKKPPRPFMTFNEHEPPQGPRSPLTNMKILGNPSIPRPVEKAHDDIDLPAFEAVMHLYESGVPVSHIQKVFSTGAFGVKGRRRLVPTRWSITAVDSMLCRNLIKEIKDYEPLNEILVFRYRLHDNLFIAILYPAKWSYEWMEAWWPGSTWNPSADNVVIEGDHEGYHGRTTYPGIGGCYYASMLATLEYLKSIKRQATAILLREIYPGFKIPVGVWFVRESVRTMFNSPPVLKTDNLDEVMELLDRETKLGSGKWLSSSALLKRIKFTKTIDEFLKND
ncbi:hypothetical protein DRN48_07595 [Thermococci archaeon]|nr:MAG: hypothetical protein DRN48_07595 [Thermococci archaeon]